jgi:ubiquinone/menaquinone biosynthesis C-methylase UbiE
MTIDHFDLLAPIYDRILKFRDVDILTRMAKLPVAGMVLDAGGGTGRVAQAIEDKAQYVVVADLSFGMLQQTAKKDGLLTVCAQVEKLPFPDHSFERVIMVDAIHHVIDQNATAEELWRLVKPAGRIVIAEPDFGTLIVKLVAIAEKIALMRSNFLAPESVAGLFPCPGASVSIEKIGYTAWINIDKGPIEEDHGPTELSMSEQKEND